MTTPLLGQQEQLLRYDRERGLVFVLDWACYPDQITFISCDDMQAVEEAIGETLHYDRRTASYLAGYGLALVARSWKGRPSDAGRAALIQVSARLQRYAIGDPRFRWMVTSALARADQAIVLGVDAEEALLQFIGEAVRRADKAAERCGRHAAELLVADDELAVYGFPGAAFAWMLSLAVQWHVPLRLLTVDLPPVSAQARIVAGFAGQLGLPVSVLDSAGLEARLVSEPASLTIAGAEYIALDGSAAATAGAAWVAELMRRHHIPFYLLGYEGPEPDLLKEVDRGAQPSSAVPSELSQADASQAAIDVVLPPLINAIVTSRGLYRPERITDSLGGDAAPLDVIPLRP